MTDLNGTNPFYVIKFDDADSPDATFTDREAAEMTLKKLKQSWECRLFCEMDKLYELEAALLTIDELNDHLEEMVAKLEAELATEQQARRLAADSLTKIIAGSNRIAGKVDLLYDATVGKSTSAVDDQLEPDPNHPYNMECHCTECVSVRGHLNRTR